MANVKTAISLQQELFEQGEALAGQMRISRSRLIALALEDFIRHHQSHKLLERINAAYQDSPDPSENALRSQMRRSHRRLVKGEW